MSNSSWHTKYRPKRVADLHLARVREQIQNFLKHGEIPRVLLFAGPKGTGKTTTSRLIASILNASENESQIKDVYLNTKKNKSSKEALTDLDPSSDDHTQIMEGTSFVVHELDAASNRKIDDVRSLRERVYLPPQQGLMAVYILDEVHMLTTEAFNALLKLLEEPPAHAVFILATTERHKVPATILSRCSEVVFTKASTQEIIDALQPVISSEKVTIADDALKLLAEQADGSFRDAVKLLQAVSLQAGNKKIEPALVLRIVGGVPEPEIESLVNDTVTKNQTAIAERFAEWRKTGATTATVLPQLMQWLHSDLLRGLEVSDGASVFKPAINRYILQQLVQIDTSMPEIIPLLAVELCFLEMVAKAQDKGGTGSQTSSQSSKKKDTSSETVETHKKEAVPIAKVAVTPIKESEIKKSLASGEVMSDSLEPLSPADETALLAVWEHFLSAVAVRNATVAALLRSAKPLGGTDTVTKLAVFYPFHREQLVQPKFMTLLQECAEATEGMPGHFEIVIESQKDAVTTEEPLAAVAEATLL